MPKLERGTGSRFIRCYIPNLSTIHPIVGAEVEGVIEYCEITWIRTSGSWIDVGD
jgi:hypothetical protein